MPAAWHKCKHLRPVDQPEEEVLLRQEGGLHNELPHDEARACFGLGSGLGIRVGVRVKVRVGARLRGEGLGLRGSVGVRRAPLQSSWLRSLGQVAGQVAMHRLPSSACRHGRCACSLSSCSLCDGPPAPPRAAASPTSRG